MVTAKKKPMPSSPVRLDAPTLALVSELAKREDRSLASMARVLIREAIAARESRPKR